MITLLQLLWLIHYVLLAIYGWEIAEFVYRRVNDPAAYQRSSGIPGLLEQKWNSLGSAAGGLGVTHVVVYGFAVQAVPLILMIYIGISIYCMLRNEAAKPFRSAQPAMTASRRKIIPIAIGAATAIGAVVFGEMSIGTISGQIGFAGFVAGYFASNFWLKRQERAASEAREREQGSKTAEPPPEDDGEFSFNKNQWDGERSSAGAGDAKYDAEADYENALSEAQKWANMAASEASAIGFAEKFERLSKNAALHPKDKLRYRLAAMLLRERLKGKGADASRSGAEPTDADLSRRGLPVPR